MQGNWPGWWSGAWFGDSETDPNALHGTATISVTALGELTAASGDISGVATISVVATGSLSSTGQDNGAHKPIWTISGVGRPREPDPQIVDIAGLAKIELILIGRLTRNEARIKARRRQIEELLELV